MRNRKLMKGMTAILAASISMTSMPVFAKTSKTKLSVSNCIISKGDKFDLDMIGMKETKGKYQVSNKKVAKITNKGIITAKRVGKLKAIWKKDKKKYVCNVKIVKAPTVSKSKITLTEGKKAKISVVKYGNSKLKVKWISKNKKIAKVTNGKITGISKGTTTIIAKIQGNKKVYEKTIKVVVKEAKIDTNINDVNSDNQNTTTIKPDGTEPENTISETPKKDDTLDKSENNNPNKDTVTNTNNGGSNNNWSGNNTGNIPNKPSPGEVVKPELPTGGAIEPEKPEVPTGGAIEPEKPEIPTGGAIEPEKPEIPTGGAIEPEKPEVPTGGAIEPEKPEKNENDVKALQELIKKQKQKGANVSEDINNAQYIWEENRLVGIHWANVGLVEDEGEEDEISFADLPELKELDCSNNNLTKLPKFYTNPDTEENTTLKILNCSNNVLDSLDVSKLIELEKLILLNNKGELAKLDLRNNPKLSKDTVECESDVNIIWKDEDALRILIKEQREKEANVSEDINSEQYKWEGDRLVGIYWADVGLEDDEENEISFADLLELKELDCSNNSLIKLPKFYTNQDTGENTTLKMLNCSNNPLNSLDSLDVSSLTVLEELNCSDNNLIGLPEIYINPDTGENTTLKILNCSNNQLDSLDVSMLTMLEELDCSSNGLTELLEIYTNPDIGENTTLKVLNCSNNQLDSLDVSMLTMLEKLDCSSNGLTELPEIYANPDTEENTTLKVLNCSNNQLGLLDVNILTVLEELDCSCNELTELTEFYTNPDTGENTTLKVLNCSNNQLDSLDVSMLTMLEKFILQDNGGELEEVDLSNNPKLSKDNDSVDCDLEIIWYGEEDIE